MQPQSIQSCPELYRYMKIFTTQDIKSIYRKTLETDGVTTLDMCRRAAASMVSEIVSRWPASRPVAVFAGPGGNGADALAMSRMLLDRGYQCEIYLFNIGGKLLSGDCRRMRDELVTAAPEHFTEVTGPFPLPEISPRYLIIDGLFGTGLTEPLTGGFTMLARYFNESGATVVSIDLPSGMFADWNSTGAINRNVVHAHLTLSQQFPHLAFLFKENAELVGDWKVVDVGLNSHVVRSTPTNFQMLDSVGVHRLLKPRDKFADKTEFGNALVIAGSHGMMGAAVLAAKGAVRSGAGRVTLHGPAWGCDIAQISVPEAMYDCDPNDVSITAMKPARNYDAIAVGPGIGNGLSTVSALDLLLKSSTSPLVLDADALNCIARQRSMLNLLPPLTILTPHVREYDRLFGEQHSDEERIKNAIKQAAELQILILLKGHYTALIRPDGKVYFNSTGTPALATPGSGDVLTGLICGFLAQKFLPEIAPLLGAYIHGMAGEIAAERMGEYSVTATDITDAIGPAIRKAMSLQ